MKKIAALLMVCILVLAMAGCGSSENTSGTEKADNGSNEKQETSGESKKDDEKVEKTETPEEPVTITMLANLSKAELTLSDLAFIEAIEEKTNTNIEIEIPASSGYAERVQLMLVSGEYPDLVMFKSASDEAFLNAVEDGIVIPLNEHLKNAPSLMEYTYDVSWNSLKVMQDENIYGVPRTSIARADGFWIRKDWLDNVGISVPESGEVSIEEFTEILTRFTFDDPDGNGVDDTYGAGSFTDADKVMTPLLTSQFGDFGWQASGGDYDYMSPQYDKDTEVYEKVLDYTRQLYLDGILDPDSAVNDSKTTRERFWRGTIGILKGFGGNLDWHKQKIKEVAPEVELDYIFVKNEDGKVQGTGYGTSVWQFWSITETCEHPEKVMEVLDYLLSDEGYDMVYYGMEGLDYNVVDGKKVYVDDLVSPMLRMNWLRRAGDSEFFIKPWYEEELKNVLRPNIDKSVASVIRSKDIGHTPNASKSPEFIDYKTTMAEVKSRIMLGDLEVDAYGELINGWYENGGETYVVEMNEYIKKYE